MQQVENCEEEATVDVQFTDLPNALIAYKVPEDLFNDASLKVRSFHNCWCVIQLRTFLYDGFRFGIFKTYTQCKI